MKATVRARRSELRCAVCHDRLDGTRYRCAGCSTTTHAACRAELARCPTLGCFTEGPRPELPRERWALATVVTAVATCAALVLAGRHGGLAHTLAALALHLVAGPSLAARLPARDWLVVAGTQTLFFPLTALLSRSLAYGGGTIGVALALVVLALEPVVVARAARR